MALRKFLFLNGTYGYHEEAAAADSLELGGLTLSGNIAMGSNKITGLGNGTDSGDAVNKSQLDAAVAGLNWKPPVQVLSIKSDATQAGSPPTAGAIGEAWVVDTWGGGYTDGDIVEWDGAQWNVIVDEASAGEPPDGTRVIVTAASAAGSFAGHEGDFAVYDATGDSWSFTDAVDGDAVLVAGEGSVYENQGFTFDTGTGWVQFTGASALPDATSASGGGIKGKVTFDSDFGLSVTSGVAKINIAADMGLEFSTGALQVEANNAQGIHVDSSGVGITLEASNPSLAFVTNELGVKYPSTGSALDQDASGMKVLVDDTSIGINGSNQLYVKEAGEAQRLEYDFTASGNLAAGDPVYVSANNTVAEGDAGNDTKAMVIGLARTAINDTESGPVCFSGLCTGVLSGATAGTAYYLADGGGLTSSLPASAKRIIRMGYAKNATDLIVDIMDLGKKAA